MSFLFIYNSYAKWYAFSVPIGSKLQQGSNALLGKEHAKNENQNK